MRITDKWYYTYCQSYLKKHTNGLTANLRYRKLVQFLNSANIWPRKNKALYSRSKVNLMYGGPMFTCKICETLGYRKVRIFTNTASFHVKNLNFRGKSNNFHDKTPNFHGFYAYFHWMFLKMSTVKSLVKVYHYLCKIDMSSYNHTCVRVHTTIPV